MNEKATTVMSASGHAPRIRAAREVLVAEIANRFPRNALSNAAEFADYLIASGYLNNKFYQEYGNE